MPRRTSLRHLRPGDHYYLAPGFELVFRYTERATGHPVTHLFEGPITFAIPNRSRERRRVVRGLLIHQRLDYYLGDWYLSHASRTGEVWLRDVHWIARSPRSHSPGPTCSLPN